MNMDFTTAERTAEPKLDRNSPDYDAHFAIKYWMAKFFREAVYDAEILRNSFHLPAGGDHFPGISILCVR